MGWLLVFFVLACIFFVGCSLKSLFVYILLSGLTFCLTHLFLSNKWGLDRLLEEFFKVAELFGFGAPLRLESSFYRDGGSDRLEELPKPLEKELRKLIANIIRDFIRTWYENVGKGEHFIVHTRELLEVLCLEGYKRASQVDSHYLVEQAIVIFHGHLERLNKAMAIVKTKDPKLRLSISSSQLLCETYKSQLSFEPPALESHGKELSYLRNVIDTLVAALSPKDTFNCDTGRFILREILTVQVMSSLVQLMIDPDWIYEAAIEILADNVNAGFGDLEVRNTDNGIGMDQGNGASKDDRQLVDDEAYREVSVENVTSFPDMNSSELEVIPRQESKDSVEDVGERIEITSSGTCANASDFQWPESSLRHPPIGESQHDNADSYLVISLEENRENCDAEENQKGSNWSTEVVPPSSLENVSSSSLTSSWAICPSSKDESFDGVSFEEMKEKLAEVEGTSNVIKTLQSFKEMTCCNSSETNEGGYCSWSILAEKGSDGEGSDMEAVPCPRLRTRSFSFPAPEERTVTVNNSEQFSVHYGLKRSASVPCKLSLPDFIGQDNEEFYSPHSPRKAFGSPFYQTSFCSSSDSFKSVSSDEDIVGPYIEKGEEVLEHADDFDLFTPETQVKVLRGRIIKQASFEESQEKVTSDSSVDELNGQRATCKLPAYKQDKEDSKDHPGNNIKESSLNNADENNAREDGSSDHRTFQAGFGARESESSFGEAFLSAGKKFVSNFKPPFKFDSLSSSSTKSCEMSDKECIDGSTENQFGAGPQGTFVSVARAGAMTHGTSGMRHLSRSHAIVEESFESDAGISYGTPKEELCQDIEGVGHEAKDSLPLAGVKRMHPSQLISIPNTVVALETTWEPGRNKYTLYKIEYDIRIWHEVYSAAVKQAKKEAKKDRMKRRLYGDPTFNEDNDAELSLENIKSRVPLKRVINRRYREFMELHNRLTSGELAVHMKDILRPNRKYNLPFGRLDPHVVEGRRKLLQYYLGSLICKPPLRNSEDVKQFLGVTEGKQISFIKPSVAQMVTQSVYVPRVDKMLSRQMTKVIDSIKTAFDSVEEEENMPEKSSSEANDKAVVPWKLADQDTFKTSIEADINQRIEFSMHCYSAFVSECVEFSLPSPPSLCPVENQEDHDEPDAGHLWRMKNKVMPFDLEEEAVGYKHYLKMSQHLGPRTAGDGSDNPDELHSVSTTNKPTMSQLPSAPGNHPDEIKDESSGTIFKKYLDMQLEYSQSQRPVEHLLLPSNSMPKSKSMEEITSQASTRKFQFTPQKILKAAKRIGQGNKTGSLENLDVLPAEKEKKHGTFKKLFKESPTQVFHRNLKKQKDVAVGREEIPSPVRQPLKAEEPNAFSAVDQPNTFDDKSFPGRALDESELQCPLSDAILSLLCELLRDRDSWLTIDRVQHGFSATLGGLLEWSIQSEIDNITSDESWAFYLNKLNEAIWPQGKLIEDMKKTKSELEKAHTRKEAVFALMGAFPGFIKLLIGPRLYQQIAVNVVESLQYPQLNKILLYTLLELLLSEVVPEIQDSLQFYRGISSHK